MNKLNTKRLLGVLKSARAVASDVEQPVDEYTFENETLASRNERTNRRLLTTNYVNKIKQILKTRENIVS